MDVYELVTDEDKLAIETIQSWNHGSFPDLDTMPWIQLYFKQPHHYFPVLSSSWTLNNFTDLPLILVHIMYAFTIAPYNWKQSRFHYLCCKKIQKKALRHPNPFSLFALLLMSIYALFYVDNCLEAHDQLENVVETSMMLKIHDPTEKIHWFSPRKRKLGTECGTNQHLTRLIWFHICQFDYQLGIWRSLESTITISPVKFNILNDSNHNSFSNLSLMNHQNDLNNIGGEIINFLWNFEFSMLVNPNWLNMHHEQWSQLCQFQTKLETIQYDTNNSHQFNMLKLHSLALKVILLKPKFIYLVKISSDFQSDIIFKNIIEICESFYSILNQFNSDSIHILNPFEISYFCFVIGMIDIIVYKLTSAQCHYTKIKYLIGILSGIGKDFDGVKRYKIRLESMLNNQHSIEYDFSQPF
ncbi:hypothetical protein BC833DRAFT_599756 [Globomyces pollinis-pini]|nr:hypothetical protein BC833DRAFT_599756 [Globomyces pollinis-pini]